MLELDFRKLNKLSLLKGVNSSLKMREFHKQNQGVRLIELSNKLSSRTDCNSYGPSLSKNASKERIYGLPNRPSTPMKPIVMAAYAGPEKAKTITAKEKKTINSSMNKAAYLHLEEKKRKAHSNNRLLAPMPAYYKLK